MTKILLVIIIFFASYVTSYAGDTVFFSPFQSSDWLGLGLTGIADFADLDSSYSFVMREQSTYSAEPRYGTTIPCPASETYSTCFAPHRYRPSGEGNPLITGLFGTRFPTDLDYAAFGVLELGAQALVAWALPEKWRDGAWGLFIGIGAADTVMNSYGGGVTFRF